jgi:WD40 repeat protein
VQIWSAQTGTLLHTLDGPSSDVEWVAWHPKGDVVLAGSTDCTAWMWSVTPAVATCMQVFAGHQGEVTCGAFSGNGKLVLTGSADGSIRVWNPKTGTCAFTFEGYVRAANERTSRTKKCYFVAQVSRGRCPWRLRQVCACEPTSAGFRFPSTGILSCIPLQARLPRGPHQHAGGGG